MTNRGPRPQTLLKVAWTSGTIWETRLPRSFRPAQHSAEAVERIRKLASQALRVDQNLFDRRLGLATLSIGVAGMELASLPDLEAQVARELADTLASANSRPLP